MAKSSPSVQRYYNIKPSRGTSTHSRRLKSAIKPGVEEAQPPPRGFGGCAPKNLKIGGELPTLANQPPSGTQEAGEPSAYGGGQKGVQGGEAPMAGGCGGCPPTKPKRGSELPLLATPPRVGPKKLANPQPTGVGKRGSRGAKPPWRGVVGGVPPQNQKEGASCPY